MEQNCQVAIRHEQLVRRLRKYLEQNKSANGQPSLGVTAGSDKIAISRPSPDLSPRNYASYNRRKIDEFGE